MNKVRSAYSIPQHGITVLELVVVVTIIGILSLVVVTRLLLAQDRAQVGAAIADADHFRKALSFYAVDYGNFPPQPYDSPAAVARILIDPERNEYMELPQGDNFESFYYSPMRGGQSYTLKIVAKDNRGTAIEATPEGTDIF